MQSSNWRKKVKWLVIFVVIALMVIAAPAFAQEEEFTWEGQWNLYQDVGSSFDLTIEIIRDADGTYRLDWGDVAIMADSDWHPPSEKTATLTVTDTYMKYVLARSYKGTPLQTLEWYFFRAERNDQLRGTHHFWTENNFSGNESAWYIVENHIDSGVVGLCAARPGVSRPEQCKGSMPETVQPEEEEEESSENHPDLMAFLYCEASVNDKDLSSQISCLAEVISQSGIKNWEVVFHLDGVAEGLYDTDGGEVRHTSYLVEPGSHTVMITVTNLDSDIDLAFSDSVTVVVEEADKALPVSLYCTPDIKTDTTDFVCGVNFYPPENTGWWYVHWHLDGSEISVSEADEDGRSSYTYKSVSPGLHTVSVTVINWDGDLDLGGAASITVPAPGEAVAPPPETGGDLSDNTDPGIPGSANPPETDQGAFSVPNEVSPGAQAGAAVGTTSALAFWFIWELMSMAGSNSGSFVNNFISLLSNSGSGTKSSGGNFPKPPPLQPAVTPPAPGPVKSPAYLGSGEKVPEIFGGEDVHTILQALELIPEYVGPTDTYEVTQVMIDNLLSGHPDGQTHIVTLSDGSLVNVNNIQGIAFDGDGQIDFSEGISIVAEIIKSEGAAPAQPPIPVPTPQPSVPTPSATPAQQGPSQPAAQPIDQQQIDQTMPEPVEDSPVEPIQEVAEQPPNDDVDLLGERSGEDYADAEAQEDFYEIEEDEPPEADMIDGEADTATDDF